MELLYKNVLEFLKEILLQIWMFPVCLKIFRKKNTETYSSSFAGAYFLLNAYKHVA